MVRSHASPIDRGHPSALQLVCMPHGGGSAAAFRSWGPLLAPSIEVHAVELPGRGRRTREPLIESHPEAVKLLADELAEGPRPFALFGHSLGALLAFELARELRRRTRVMPVHIFVLGHAAPQLAPEVRGPRLTPTELVAHLRRIGGTPPEVLEHPGLLKVVLPILSSDLEIARTYHFENDRPLDVPITAFVALDDPSVPRDRAARWADLTTGPFRLEVLAGTHFPSRDQVERMLGVIAQTLRPATARPPSGVDPG